MKAIFSAVALMMIAGQAQAATHYSFVCKQQQKNAGGFTMGMQVRTAHGRFTAFTFDSMTGRDEEPWINSEYASTLVGDVLTVRASSRENKVSFLVKLNLNQPVRAIYGREQRDSKVVAGSIQVNGNPAEAAVCEVSSYYR